ncbi:MAG TPA: hypothetical protein VFQ22_03230, partial [Longimicrobiales bacterium]|nr:hypothetical protein [Longimicrobiales bacterium]
PGWFGGANWYGAAADPETGVLYVPSNTAPIVVQLVEPDPATSDFRYVRGGTRGVQGPRGLPLFKGPHTRITAIDLSTGEHVWQIPVGDGVRQQLVEMGIPDPGPQGGGSITGPLLTPTLLFVGHTGARDGGEGGPALLAIDKATGRILHAAPLPAEPTGTPMTYEVGGRQYVAVAYGSADRAGLVALSVD